MDHVSQLTELIESGLKPGAHRSAGALTLVPLFGGAPSKDYMLASEAIGSGLLEINELDGASVPQVAANNLGGLPVLLVDGEHIEGAMQNRVLNTTVLIAAQQETLLPVACVEQGRWHYERAAAFAASEDLAYPRLRAKNATTSGRSARMSRGRGVDQSEVWADVSAKHAEIGVQESDTGALRHAFTQRRAQLEEITTQFAAPEPGQTGVLCYIGARPMALDAFDRPETLAQLWPRMVSGYALDACRRRELRSTTAPSKTSSAQLRRPRSLLTMAWDWEPSS